MSEYADRIAKAYRHNPTAEYCIGYCYQADQSISLTDWRLMWAAINAYAILLAAKQTEGAK